ncbi:hypothetical protein GALL_275730 [mine drainage metagenome]|uniref:Uncharacterized protein n=1 Tax=mine drainage metagenome TaxID=410659 RepID=A0A1J5RR04_9ZZZZ
MKLVAALRSRFFDWALRGNSPETAPIVLGQRRVFVLPTRFGLAYAGMLLVMLIGAINYQLSLGYALVFLAAGLGVVTIFHSFRNLAQISISPGRAEPVFAGEPASFQLLLTNPSARARLAIRLRLPGRGPVECDLPGQATKEVRLAMPTIRRGWLDLPRVRLSTRYPLGLIRAWGYAAPAQRLLVYPAPATEAAAVPAFPGETNGQLSAFAGSEDFAGLRSHQAADPPRHVAWKAVARRESGPLLTKLFDGAVAQTLWLDWDALPSGLDVEARLSLLTRWVCDADAAGAYWGLRLPGAALAPARGGEHYRACLRALALYD